MAFRVTIRFLQLLYCGRGEGEPEWPPSPLRVFQALTAAAAARWNQRIRLENAIPALQWLESLPPPTVIAPLGTSAVRKHRLYVPDNVGDLVAASWSRGRDSTIADFRSEKDVQPTYLAGDTLHYIHSVNAQETIESHVTTLGLAARCITHLGWGWDMVIGDASVADETELSGLEGERWIPARTDGSIHLRAARQGTLADLMQKHNAFLNRIVRGPDGAESLSPVPPLTTFIMQGYRRVGDPIMRPYVVFELRGADGSFFAYPQKRFVHISGMLRHLAMKVLERSLPSGVGSDWLDTYVAGHAPAGANYHPRFSYLPLLTIGHAHADQAVRRVMIVAPEGDGALLDHLTVRLALRQLEPVKGTTIPNPPRLIRVYRDNVARSYLDPSPVWSSVTPVILPGHDDHKPEKTRKLIEAALRQARVEQSCEFEWGPISHFPKSLSAHKYDRHGRPIGYIRPHHLLTQTAVHLTLRFQNSDPPGPLFIGVGRHYGFGVMARMT